MSGRSDGDTNGSNDLTIGKFSDVMDILKSTHYSVTPYHPVLPSFPPVACIVRIYSGLCNRSANRMLRPPSERRERCDMTTRRNIPNDSFIGKSSATKGVERGGGDGLSPPPL